MRSGDNRVTPLVNSGMSPVLFCDESHVSADGAALACPQCGGANLHLDEIHFATPTEDHYAPTVGVSIDAATAIIRDDGDARQLHAGANRGAMLAAGYWCENGCRGRIELREHKGHLYASLHNQPPEPPDGLWLPDLSPVDPGVEEERNGNWRQAGTAGGAVPVVPKAAARSSGVLADWAAAPAARRLRMPRVRRLAL